MLKSTHTNAILYFYNHPNIHVPEETGGITILVEIIAHSWRFMVAHITGVPKMSCMIYYRHINHIKMIEDYVNVIEPFLRFFF